MKRTELILVSPARFFLGITSIGLGLGFMRYFDKTTFFPWFPNVLDSLFMVAVGLIFLYDVVKRNETK